MLPILLLFFFFIKEKVKNCIFLKKIVQAKQNTSLGCQCAEEIGELAWNAKSVFPDIVDSMTREQYFKMVIRTAI